MRQSLCTTTTQSKTVFGVFGNDFWSGFYRILSRNQDVSKDDAENKNYSLFCALYTASVEVEGAYNHRSAVMQRIRKTIVEIYPKKELEHRLRDFNNLPETDHKVLMDLLTQVRNQVNEKLKK